MTFTTAELDRLCGSAPTEYRSCGRRNCDRTVGPYYSAALAREALAEHALWVHGTVDSKSGDAS